MVLLKLQIPQTTFEQLLTVASRDWRPTVWQAEWLLRKAIEAAATSADEEPVPTDMTRDEP